MRIALMTCLLTMGAALQAQTAAPAGHVMFVSPKDGATVHSPVIVKMAIMGMKVRPAGEDPNDKTTGHHHIIVDGASIPAGQVIPNDAKHLHYGKGQTEAKLDLKPGDHTLTLQLADGAHRSYGPELSQTIKIHVQ
jgi:hypothetical protein